MMTAGNQLGEAESVFRRTRHCPDISKVSHRMFKEQLKFVAQHVNHTFFVIYEWKLMLKPWDLEVPVSTSIPTELYLDRKCFQWDKRMCQKQNPWFYGN